MQDLELKVVSTDEPEEWDRFIERCGLHDIYHCAALHKVEESVSQDRARLFVVEAGRDVFALPLLIRDIPTNLGIADSSLFDASSIYGYPGPIAGPGARNDAFLAAARQLICERLKELNVVTVFCRHNPLLRTEQFFGDWGALTDCGQTVAIDLSKPIEEQLRETSKNHRRDVRQALSKGLSVVHDPELKQLDRFVELYWDTMRRVGAASAYRFPMEYFRSLSDHLGPSVQAFHAVFDEAIVASSLIFVERDIVQYHLSGTSASFAAMSPSRVVLEHIRIWATENRYKWFHLGGGVGGREDSLFTFKARFSKNRCNYRVSKIVIDAALNSKLGTRRREVLRDEGRTTSTGEFFPTYRDPGSDPSAATSIEGYK